MTEKGLDVYDKLGVKRVLNACSWVTTLGGSIMPPEVIQAIAVWLKDQLVFVELSSEEASAIDGNSKAIQVDGGSEFEAIFEEECQEKRMCH